MTPSHTRRKGKLYRYYVSTDVLKRDGEACPIRRVPAGEIETAVIDQLRCLLRAPDELRHDHEVLRDGEVEVEPVVGLDAGHDEGVSGVERVDRHEPDAQVVAPYERARDLALDDPGEERRHGQIE